MSRIYLHRIDGPDVEIGGPERAHFGCLTNDLALSALGSLWDHWIVKCFPANHHIHGPNTTEETVRIALSQSGDSHLEWRGDRFRTWDLILNTAMVLGGTSVKLATRIHAQCEVFLRVEGKNRAWFADLVDRAWKRDRIFRDGMGWATALPAMRASATEPIVMSYSVCSQFPAAELMGFDGSDDEIDEQREQWWQKPDSERWADGLAALRDPKSRWPELKPEGFEEYGFGNGKTFMDLQTIVNGTNGMLLPGYEKAIEANAS